MLFRKARIDGKTNEKQGNGCHNIGLEGTSAGKAAFWSRRDKMASGVAASVDSFILAHVCFRIMC